MVNCFEINGKASVEFSFGSFTGHTDFHELESIISVDNLGSHMFVNKFI